MLNHNELISISEEIERGKDPIYAVPNSMNHIADGTDRTVYEYNKNKVVKFSLRPGNEINQNTREADFYQNVKNTPISDKFAKVHSQQGSRYIIQEYVDNRQPVSDSEIKQWINQVSKYGVEVYDDRKENFGYRNGELVMIDYAGCFFSE